VAEYFSKDGPYRAKVIEIRAYLNEIESYLMEIALKIVVFL